MPRLFEDSHFEHYRDQAKELAEMRDKYLKLSQEAYRKGNKQQAKDFSITGKNYAKKMDLANRTAAQSIYAYHNATDKRSPNEIDLHGLFVSEAIEYLELKVAKFQSENKCDLIVIVGRGIHSKTGPKIRPAVIKYAEKQKMNYQVDSPHVGCIRFELEMLPKPRKTLQILPAVHFPRQSQIYTPSPPSSTSYPTTPRQTLPTLNYQTNRPQPNRNESSLPLYSRQSSDIDINIETCMMTILYSLIFIFILIGLGLLIIYLYNLIISHIWISLGILLIFSILLCCCNCH